jgi:hypothetical protein
MKRYENCELLKQKLRPEPSLIYEKKRRRIRTTIQNMWDNFLYHVDTIKQNNQNMSTVIQPLVDSIYDHKM